MEARRKGLLAALVVLCLIAAARIGSTFYQIRAAETKAQKPLRKLLLEQANSAFILVPKYSNCSTAPMRLGQGSTAGSHAFSRR